MIVIYNLNKATTIKVAKFVSTITVAFLLMLGLYFYFTATLVDAADDFLQSLSGKTAEEKMTYLSEDFKSQINNKASFAKHIDLLSLNTYLSAEWGSRSIKSNRGSLAGVIKTKYEVLPATLSFVKEGDQWRVYSLQIRSEQSQEKNESRELPDERAQLLIARQTLLIFMESVKQKSMQALYDNSAAIWRKHTSVSELNNAFAKFYNEDIDLLRQVGETQPVFEHKAKLDSEGFMLIAGHYKLNNQLLIFKQRYIYEGLAWGLVGLDIKLNK